MDDSLSTFINENRKTLKSAINLTNIKELIDADLPALSHTFEQNGPDFYDELVKQDNKTFFRFLKVLKKSQYKIQAELIEAKLKQMENNKINGLCLIINNIKFDKSERSPFKDRIYSGINETALNKAFTKVGFKVYVKQNLKAAEMTEEIKLFCTYSELNYSSYVVVILTHGESRGNSDILYGTDMKHVYKDDIIYELNKREHYNMFEKPKMAFFQACRGKKEYITVQGHETDAGIIPIQNTMNRTVLPFKISNTTVVHSALPGHKCHSLKNKGSVFCQILAEVLERDHKKHDLNAMLVTVNREIREKNPGEEEFIHIEEFGVTESIRFGYTQRCAQD